MSDEAVIRRANLRALCQRRGWSIKDLSTRLTWGRYTYWRDLLDDDAKKSCSGSASRPTSARPAMTCACAACKK